MRLVRSSIGALTALLWVAPLGAQAPTGTIRGRVTDASTQELLAGVTITVGHRGALSQADGHYTLTGIPAGADSVRARMLGYAPASQSITITGGDTIQVDFALTPQAVGLSSVVVVAYGEQRLGALTGSQSQVSSKDFNSGAIVSPQQLIENKVAGVQVVDNNEPGGGLSIRVRGQASVNAGSEPLYVVDGVPLGGGSGGGLTIGRDPLNFLNPNDIASVTVLKDAAAAALYGANASNGVVLITTKSGDGSPHVQYSASMSAASVTRLPSMLNGPQFAAAVAGYASQFDTLLQGQNTDWFALVTRTGWGQEHNVVLSGAGAGNNYRFSVGYLNQDGILKGTTAERLSLGLNYRQQLYDNRLNIQANVKGSRSDDRFTPNGVLYNAGQMGPTQSVMDPTSATGYYNWPGNSLTSADNPIEVLNLATDHGITYRSVGNLQTKYDFSDLVRLQGLTGTVNLGYDVSQADRVTFYPNNIHFETKQPDRGSYNRTTPTESNVTLESYLNFAPPTSVGPGQINLTGGYSYSKSHGDYPGIHVTQFSSNDFADNGVPADGLLAPFPPNIQESKLISFFGRVDYNINDRYLASVSIRRDGSSRFGPGNQWGNFPAASVAWRLSQERFLRGQEWITDLKLRASYGKTGNQAFGNYLQHVTFQPCNSLAEIQFGNEFVCTARPSAVDPNIKWESTGTWDVGVDYSLDGGRFSGTLDWYNKHTSDLIFTVPVPAGTNLSDFVTTNIGKMKNTGIDLSLNADVLRGGASGLSWTAGLTASHNSNELLSINPRAVGAQLINVGGIAGGVGSTIQVLQPGEPINSFFVCKQVYQNGKPVQNNYYDLSGNVVTGCSLNSNTRPFHDPAPKWIFGLSSTFNYHRFELSFTLRAWLGNYVYNNVASNLGDYRELQQGAPYNLHASVLETGFTTQQLLSDYYVEDASFLRMDNLTLAYQFPYRGQQLRLYGTVQSLFTVTGYNGVDPTAGLNGIDNNIYPRSRIFTSGLSVQF